MTIVEALTIKNPGEVAADNADPPEGIESIPVYNDFFSSHEIFQRVHVHFVGLRVKDPSKEDFNAGAFKTSFFKKPTLKVETYGEDTGSTDYFPIGKHSTLKAQTKKGPTPVWDVICMVIGKKEGTEGIKISVSGKEPYSFDTPASEFPSAGDGWKEFLHTPEDDDADNVEFVYKIRISDCAERTVSQEDLASFLNSSDTLEYTETVIEADADINKAVLQSWKHKEPAKKAVLWHLGRNDCFMHPHMANPLFIDQGYDIYVLNYSCNGLCNRFGFVEDPNLRSHNPIKDFNLYLDQIEKAIEMLKDGTSYDTVLGYAHSTGAPVLINYLLERGDAAFDGFVFNAPFLEWGSMNFAAQSQIVEDITLALMNNHPDPNKKWGTASTPEEIKDTPVVYKDTEVKMSAWSAKLWTNFFFDWRSRPLHSVATTTGFAGGVSRVHKKLTKRAKKHQYCTLKPLIVLSSRGDDVLQNTETLTFIDGVGPARVEIELGYNSHDVFLSSEKEGVDMAINFIKTWMQHKGF